MNMFVRPIWAFKIFGPEMRAARRAGWRAGDLLWERLSEAGNSGLLEGKIAKAAMKFRFAYLLSALLFDNTDPRRGTSYANMGLVAQLSNAPALAKHHYGKALSVWAHIPVAIDKMTIMPRARSSLFHLRMEARHWDVYCANMQARMTNFAEETETCLCAMREGLPPSYRLYERWNGEKPAIFDDTRKILSACLLVANPQSPRRQHSSI